MMKKKRIAWSGKPKMINSKNKIAISYNKIVNSDPLIWILWRKHFEVKLEKTLGWMGSGETFPYATVLMKSTLNWSGRKIPKPIWIWIPTDTRERGDSIDRKYNSTVNIVIDNWEQFHLWHNELFAMLAHVQHIKKITEVLILWSVNLCNIVHLSVHSSGR